MTKIIILKESLKQSIVSDFYTLSIVTAYMLLAYKLFPENNILQWLGVITIMMMLTSFAGRKKVTYYTTEAAIKYLKSLE